MATEWHTLIEQYRYFAFRAPKASQNLLDDAVRVRRRTFQEEYGSDSNIDLDEYDPTAIHVLAYLGNEPVSSYRINPHGSAAGLELAALANISVISGCGPSIAEASKFAIPKEHRRISAGSFLTLGLIKAAFAVAQHEHFSDYIIWVRPDIQSIYGVWGFVEIPGLRFEHPRLGNLIHQVVRLDLTRFETGGGGKRWVSRVFHEPAPQNFVFLL